MGENRRKNAESGAVLVESAIYFPLVICTVMAMIYLGLLQMQESALSWMLERIVTEVAREEAYPGYGRFRINEGHNVDFNWGSTMPPVSQVNAYFAAHHERLGALYREIGVIGNLMGGSGHRTEYDKSGYSEAVRSVIMVAAGSVGVPTVAVERGLLASSVTVTVTHQIPVPGVIRYLGLDGRSFRMETKAVKSIVNPGEFVRNVDLAVDLVWYLLEKLGLDGDAGALIDKTVDIIYRIL